MRVSNGALVFISVAGLAAFLTFQIGKKVALKADQTIVVQKLPAFSFVGLNNCVVSDLNFRTGGRRLIVNYFDPGCEHCQYMAGALVKNAQRLQKVTILMITTADSIRTANFYTDFQLYGLPNLIVARDERREFQRMFGPAVIPSFFIYKDETLLRKITGETEVKILLEQDE